MYVNQYVTIENEVQNALACINADERDAWIKCGMAIKQELGDQAFGIWDKWSSTSPKYSAVEAQKQWKSFKSVGEGVGLGTLFYLAKKNGFVHSPDLKQERPSQETLERQQADSLRQTEALEQKRLDAAVRAQKIWNVLEEDAQNNPSETTLRIQQHPYVNAKDIDAKGVLWCDGDWSIGGMSLKNTLALPLKKDGTIVSLQFISADGEKRFLPDGEKGSMEIGNFSTVPT